ncbi:MAG: hypothetical protein AB7F79_10095 [Steroidobacteraceae bacterium]
MKHALIALVFLLAIIAAYAATPVLGGIMLLIGIIFEGLFWAGLSRLFKQS